MTTATVTTKALMDTQHSDRHPNDIGPPGVGCVRFLSKRHAATIGRNAWCARRRKSYDGSTNNFILLKIVMRTKCIEVPN